MCSSSLGLLGYVHSTSIAYIAGNTQQHARFSAHAISTIAILNPVASSVFIACGTRGQFVFHFEPKVHISTYSSFHICDNFHFSHLVHHCFFFFLQLGQDMLSI